MASTLSFVEFVVEQMSGAGTITFRKMFGEYGLYCNGKIIAFVCDDMLFIKPTNAGREYIENIVESPPYPGAKLYFLIEDQLDDNDWMSELVRITADELPEPKPKKSKKIIDSKLS
jgi:TfoX/Sxy family transcriptional regulator of competence genes